jgi:signal transduction histidine kinase
VNGGTLHIPILVPQISPRSTECLFYLNEVPDMLVQGSFAEAHQLGTAVENIPAGSSAKPALNRILRLIGQAVEKGSAILRGSPLPLMTSTSLERALSDTIDEFSPSGVRVRLVVTGQSKELKPEIQEEVCLIAREALSNALRHSEASLIEVEIEYLRRSLRLIIRDNGQGMDCKAIRGSFRSHGGLDGMQERAQMAGGQLSIWSRRGAGTEVDVTIPLSFVASAAA